MNQKLLHNLLQTWEKLAPSECYLSEIEEPTYDFGGEFCYEIGVTDTHLIWYLQGYIQQCIESRDEWDWMVVSGQSPKEYKVFDATVWVDGSEFSIEAKATVLEALLTAYLTALTMQRPVVGGSWKHFKGATMGVLGLAKWTGCNSDTLSIGLPKSAVFIAEFRMEETPDSLISFYQDKDGFFYLYDCSYDDAPDLLDRIFYNHNDENWARNIRSFLGIVGAEHPESEGLLRFVQLKGEKS